MKINFDKVPAYIHREIDYPGRIVKKGDRNRAVRRVQEWLNFHECRTDVDQDFGPATDVCVKKFQKKSTLPITGRVNKTTWAALVKPMQDALGPPKGIGAMHDASAVKAVAHQHLMQHPVEIGGENCGPWVRLYCKGNDGPDWPWCAGFVSMIMQQAYFYRSKRPPLKGSVSCDQLASQAKESGLFIVGSDVYKSRFDWHLFNGCCIFLRRRATSDWNHTGFGLQLENLTFETIEGNTNNKGVREGFEACSRTRSIKGNYDFIMVG